MPPHFSSILQILRNLIFALAGLGFGCWQINAILPVPALPYGIREKISHLGVHGDEYTAVFLGSSRIQNHLMPRVFDQVLGEHGVPMHSFNCGISALHAPEDDYLLDLILAQPHRRLRWVFVEIDYFDNAIRKDVDGTLRGLYWHDWPRLCSVFHGLFDGSPGSVFHRFREMRENAPVFLTHLELFLQRTTNLGRGAEFARRRLFRLAELPSDGSVLGKRGDGWVPALPRQAESTGQRSGVSPSLLRERQLKPPQKEEADRGSQAVVAAILKKIAAAGATPVVIIPPRTREYYFYPERLFGEGVPVVDLCDPRRYPDLYREDLHVDNSHLNAQGAELLTRIVAERFLASLANQGRAR